jgi:uncharacterized membrane protein
MEVPMMLRLRFSQGLRHGPHVFAWLFLLLVIAALVVVIVALIRIRRLAAPPSQSGSWSAEGSRIDPALAELRVRYARGEVSWEEYTQRATNLGFPASPGSGAYIDSNQRPPAP